ncbi:MAG: DUF222 domain-containing protein [Acidimicrobiia bacterium]|nr:DUF222 domain-containing protein [Acidimicrobiia bacterium]
MFDIVIEDPVEGLESVPAGPELAAALAQVEMGGVDAYGRVEVWRAHQRLVAHYQAKGFLDVVAVEDHFLDRGDNEEQAFEGAAAEFEAAGALTRRGADSEVRLAEGVWRRLPAVGAALFRGDIDLRRARRLVDGTAHVPDEAARKIVDGLIDDAGELTPSQLAGRVRRRCIDHDPEEAKTRYEAAVEGRAAMTMSNLDGTATLYIHNAAPTEVYAAARHIDWLAREHKRLGDKRPIDQIRADVALDLLQGKPHTGNPRVLGGVHIHTTLEMLTRISEAPGELAGYGPVIADIARQTAEQQHGTPWEYTVTDTNGAVISTGTTKRGPTAAQARYARARHRTCVFPGCRMPAVDSDLDHQDDWQHTGRTDAEGLYPHCRHHHRIRHQHGWTYQELNDGRIEYTTRLGHKHQTQPRDPPLE